MQKHTVWLALPHVGERKPVTVTIHSYYVYFFQISPLESLHPSAEILLSWKTIRHTHLAPSALSPDARGRYQMKEDSEGREQHGEGEVTERVESIWIARGLGFSIWDILMQPCCSTYWQGGRCDADVQWQVQKSRWQPLRSLWGTSVQQNIMMSNFWGAWGRSSFCLWMHNVHNLYKKNSLFAVVIRFVQPAAFFPYQWYILLFFLL